VALRKAVDAARAARQASPAAPHPQVSASKDFENGVSSEPLAAPNDPDLLERLRHGPNPPRDPRLKR
jgi:hypothetical protein